VVRLTDGKAGLARLSGSCTNTNCGLVYPSSISRRLMSRSTVFKTNRTQAVRLPKAVAFPEDVRQVEIIKLGQARLIIPVGRRWDDFFLNGPQVSEDFMSERVQPPAEEREPL
jgi:antitoxin VapB